MSNFVALHYDNVDFAMDSKFLYPLQLV